MKKPLKSAFHYALLEITKESGEVIKEVKFQTELGAHEQFEKLENIKWPLTYEGLKMDLSEYPENNVGSIRVVVYNHVGDRFIRRELWRKP